MSTERTLLSYVRTALSFGVAGISMNQFASSWSSSPALMELAGAGLAAASVPTLAYGVYRYFKHRRSVLQE